MSIDRFNLFNTWVVSIGNRMTTTILGEDGRLKGEYVGSPNAPKNTS